MPELGLFDCSTVDVEQNPLLETSVVMAPVGGDGSDSTNAGTSCKAILDTHGGRGDGLYWVTLRKFESQRVLGIFATEVYCDMTGGGWTYSASVCPFTTWLLAVHL